MKININKETIKKVSPRDAILGIVYSTAFGKYIKVDRQVLYCKDINKKKEIQSIFYNIEGNYITYFDDDERPIFERVGTIEEISIKG